MDNKDYPKVRREAVRQGWRVEGTKKGEMFYSPNGIDAALWHKTPSDANALRVFVRHLAKGGFLWPPPRRKPRA